MLRSKFHICGIDSSKIDWSIAVTTQENLITILIRYGMWTLPEQDLGWFGWLYKVLCITCKFWPASTKKFCGIFMIIDRNDTELIWAIYQKSYLRQGWVMQLLLIQIAELQMPIGILASGLAYVIPYPSARRDFCIQASRRWHILIPDWNRQHHHPALFYHTYSTWFHSFRPPFWITSLILFCFEMPFDTWQTSRSSQSIPTTHPTIQAF